MTTSACSFKLVEVKNLGGHDRMTRADPPSVRGRHPFGYACGIDHGPQKRSRSSLPMTSRLLPHYPKSSSNFLLYGVPPGEDAAGRPFGTSTAPRVVEIAFKGMHDVP